MSYVDSIVGETPQTEPMAGQVPNSGGGYAYELTPLKRLERFLILGSDSPTYYASARALTRENALCVIECWKCDHVLRSSLINQVSTFGRAPKNDAAVFAVALGLASDSPVVREAARFLVNSVCRTGTHLFQLVDAVDKLRGWGRGLRSTIAAWYGDKLADDLAYQVIKYQSREKWSHRDVLRLVHPKAPSPQHAALYRWIADPTHGPGERTVARSLAKGTPEERGTLTPYPEVGKENIPRLVIGYERVKKAKTEDEVVGLITEFNLSHEMVPGEWKAKDKVWSALADRMPLHALVRNLGNLTARGIIAPLSDMTVNVATKLVNNDLLRKSRMHPLTLLMALRQYEIGRGNKGKLTWTPDASIKAALETAFYKSFETVEPTGKRILLALDVSGSMSCSVGDNGITARELAACLAMVTMRTEKNWYVTGFSDTLSALGLTPNMSLREVCDYTSLLPFSHTDCALPMLWAAHDKVPVDAFVVITDCETNANSVHPHVALNKYRKEMARQAKLAVVAMTATNFTIAQPDDAGMMDFCGMDSSGPAVLADFIRS
jgi:60 kDa SS-A/Ro ribonucleoprotein